MKKIFTIKIMRKTFTILLLLVAFISVKAADILVNSSGLAGSYTTISAAVQAASAGDRILISPQVMPYQEDSLVIDKDLTLMPYATNSFVSFEGNIQLTLDSIDNFTLIGFRDNQEFETLWSVLNDTTTNLLSVVNIIDCQIDNIRMDQPKTSLYLSYSDIRYLAFAHGDIIGNKIKYMYFGNFNYNSAASQALISSDCSGSTGQDYINCILRAPYYFWTSGHQRENNLNNSNYHSTECDLFTDYIPFGNVDVYSDTCNIIANYFDGNNSDYAAFNFFNLDFPVNFSNNYCSGHYDGVSQYYLLAPTAKGVNQFINNNYNEAYHIFNLAYCPSNGLFNFSDISIHNLNNVKSGGMRFFAPNNGGNSNSYSSLPIVKNSLMAYNITGNSCYETAPGSSGMCNVFFEIGPYAENPSNTNPDGTRNPSTKYLNLDLTPNIPGVDGGSNSWFNYHGVTCSYDPGSGQTGVNTNNNSTTTEELLYDILQYNLGNYNNYPEDWEMTYNNAGRMPEGGKARITYLNLPTQIFDPANIRVKAKAVHGN